MPRALRSPYASIGISFVHLRGHSGAGKGPGSSVVDTSGRVHRVNGLHVVDGNVLPRSSRVNPALSIYAWRLHVAEQLIMSNGRNNPIHTNPEQVLT
jgi:choline dehydrogenase-like flavoprotein